jgi:hypothetical protein
MRKKAPSDLILKKKLSEKQNIIFWILLSLLSLAPIGTVLIKIITGAFPFWYDPARDMLSALSNLSKPTLIGPPTGIPGIFYGPYWIWLLSFGELFSKNPKIVDFITLTIPYFIIFPYILTRFKKVLSVKTAFMLWLLFLLGFNTYSFYLWNPHPAPLIFLIVVLLLLISRFDAKEKKPRLLLLVSGFSLGILVNFHISFGIAITVGTFIFFLMDTVFTLKKEKILLDFFTRILNGVLFLFGFLFSFSPFILFEIRHNFSQTKTFINALLHVGAVVTTSGLTKIQIIHAFFEKIPTLLGLPFWVGVGIFLVMICLAIYSLQKNVSFFSKDDKRLVLILLSDILGIGIVYLTAKNPIWEYHFIGVEVIFLLLLGLIIEKVRIFKALLFIWLFFLTAIFLISPQNTLRINPTIVSGNLASEMQIVKKINSDSEQKPYTVFVYSPSIYSYEYSYLFKYLYNNNVPYNPSLNPEDSSLSYIVFPPQVPKAIYDDFIHYRTPTSEYKTTEQFEMPDKSIILKRVRLNKQ